MTRYRSLRSYIQLGNPEYHESISQGLRGQIMIGKRQTLYIYTNIE